MLVIAFFVHFELQLLLGGNLVTLRIGFLKQRIGHVRPVLEILDGLTCYAIVLSLLLSVVQNFLLILLHFLSFGFIGLSLLLFLHHLLSDRLVEVGGESAISATADRCEHFLIAFLHLLLFFLEIGRGDSGLLWIELSENGVLSAHFGGRSAKLNLKVVYLSALSV